MKNLLCSISIVFLLITGVSSATALTIVNGGFETGDFTGWTLVSDSDSSVTVYDYGVEPTEGGYFANLYAMAMMGQKIAWKSGDTLTFDWNFKANDDLPYNDFSFFSIYDIVEGGIDFFILSTVATLGDSDATGWNTYSYTFNRDGAGGIIFGVINLFDFEGDSQLYIDNVTGSSPVPEPATLFLLGAGLLGLASWKKR